MTMNNEGLKCEIQELGAIGDILILAFFFPLSIAIVRQAGRSRPVADVHELCHITALCRVPKGYSIMRYATRLLLGCYNSLAS